MNLWKAFSVVATKLTFLACFSLMGVAFSTNADALPPCHQMAMTQTATATQQEKDCPACETSQHAWEQQLVFSNELTITAPALVPSLLASAEFWTAPTTTDTSTTAPDPPDDVGVWHAELVVKNSTVFVI